MAQRLLTCKRRSTRPRFRSYGFRFAERQVVVMEDIAHGERVREYTIEGKTADGWKELSRGTSIGHKKIDRVEPVEVSAVRLRCSRSVAEPLICRLAVYDTHSGNR